MTEALVDFIGALGALDGHELLDAVAHVLLGFVKLGSVGGEAGHLDLVAEIVLHGVGQNEVAVGQALHEGGSAETVRTVVREVTFADCEEALD